MDCNNGGSGANEICEVFEERIDALRLVYLWYASLRIRAGHCRRRGWSVMLQRMQNMQCGVAILNGLCHVHRMEFHNSRSSGLG